MPCCCRFHNRLQTLLLPLLKTSIFESTCFAYHPSTMLKLFIYGYFNRVQSSRRLEREAGRNVELMWLLGRLAPDFKTIADFRKDNTGAIQSVCRTFVQLCCKLDLFSDALIAIDGSKFKAVNHRDRNFTPAKLKYRLKLIDESIKKYLLQIESADRQEASIAKLKTDRLENKIASLKQEVARLNAIEKELLNTPDKQLSMTDPDARSMKTRGTGIVGYNVQAAVDSQHHILLSLMRSLTPDVTGPSYHQWQKKPKLSWPLIN